MQVAVVPVALMEGVVVALSFHVKTLNLPLPPVLRSPVGEVLISQHVSELIESEILDLVIVPIKPINHLRRHNMVEGSVV